MRRLRWLFRACELWEIGEWVFVGLLCAGLALFGAGAVAEGPFRGPASERAAHEGHDSLVLVFGTLGGFFGLLTIVGLIAVIRGVRRGRDGRWG